MIDGVVDGTRNILAHDTAWLAPVLSPLNLDHRRSCTQLPSALSQPSKEEVFSRSASETEWAGRGNIMVLRPSRGPQPN